MSASPEDVKRWRQALGLSQRGAAELLGVSERTVTYWEQGRQHPPHYWRYAAAATLYRLPPWPPKEEQQ